MTDLATTPAATDTSLTIRPDLTLDEWAELGRPLLQTSASLWWWLGDWLLYAEHQWATDQHGEEIPGQMAIIRQKASTVAGVELDSLRQARRVARQIPAGRRRAAVPWSLHLDVAALAPEDADRLLADAEEHGWSRRDMRAAIKDVMALDVDETEPEPEPLPPSRPLRAGFRVMATEADRPVVEELLAAHVAQMEKQLARRKITATVEVA